MNEPAEGAGNPETRAQNKRKARRENPPGLESLGEDA